MDNLTLLQNAYDAAEAGQLEHAYKLVQQAIRNDPQDYDAWWALAHVSPSRTEREKALQRVLYLRPDHPEARAMMNEMRNPAPTQKPKYGGIAYGKTGQVTGKDYLPHAIVTLFLYFALWFVGLIVNVILVNEANRLEREGALNHNVGCLKVMLWLNLVPAVCGFIFLVISFAVMD